MEIKKVGVAGLGAMGTGIAQVSLQSGYEVIAVDIDQTLVDRAVQQIEKSFLKMVRKEQISPEKKDESMSRLMGETEMAALKDCDLVIEAAFEDLEIKTKIFQSLEEICSDKTIFASNTSTLSITDLVARTGTGGRLVGLHFFNPPTVMKLVEVIKTITTDDEVLKIATDFVKSLNKIPVMTGDGAGFIVNRLLTPYLFDAMNALAQGVADVNDIDNAMALGCGHPMGPLKLSDFIGLDILIKGGTILYEEYKDKRYAPPAIMKRLVALGFTGFKSGSGFYDWSDPKHPVPRSFE
ncbi:putative 3-hydroxybutyryl-CoA dehydrogenase [delta proteobacterium NaphS2]|nr:putative 3-hydroxybutyryl-CoA dehydrogenase [delta proteobacterium NaphS2]